VIQPDVIQAAARRLAGKMVADQAAKLMMTITNLDAGKTTDATALVIVARDTAIGKLLKFIDDSSKGFISEIIPS